MPREHLVQHLTGGGGQLGDLLGRPLADDQSPAPSAVGTEVDHPVGGLDDIEIVLDDDDRVAARGESVQHGKELADVVEMQAGRRFIEDIERLAGAFADEFLRELDPLRLAAGERRRLLADMDIVQPDAVQER